MSLIYNGTTVDKVIYNGTNLDKIIYNGTTVFTSIPPNSTITINFQSSGSCYFHFISKGNIKVECSGVFNDDNIYSSTAVKSYSFYCGENKGVRTLTISTTDGNSKFNKGYLSGSSGTRCWFSLGTTSTIDSQITSTNLSSLYDSNLSI